MSELIQKSNKLKQIARVGIGLDSVPLEDCLKKNITVTYTPDAVTDAVAELTIGLIISLSRKILIADQATRTGAWNRFEGKGLKEMTVGLVGYGRIGRRVAEALAGLRTKSILVNDILDKSNDLHQLKTQGVDVNQVSLDSLTSECDVISLHLPRTPKSENLFDQKRLSNMKAGALLVNTARGGLIDEHALKAALESGHLGGAALDVFKDEPYRGELTSTENVILTQHMGSCSFEARDRMEAEAVQDVLNFLNGKSLENGVDIKSELEKLK